jgi:hypothetical protein
MSQSTVRWLVYSDSWDFTDDIKPSAENPKSKISKGFSIAKWNTEPDTWGHEFGANASPSLSNIYISKTNLWVGEKGLINLSCSINDEEKDNIKYKILVNSIKAVELDNFISTPTDINIDIPIDLFTEEENLLELIVFDEGGGETSFKYNIIKENRDTFIFKRIFDFKEDYITDENIEVIYGRGLTLKEIGRGEVNIEIPTEGKSKISNIVIEGGEDKEEKLTIDNQMIYAKDLRAGRVYESRLLTEYSDITNIVSDGDASLVESNNKYYTYQNNEFIEVEPTVENFENNSIDLSEIITPNEDNIKPYKLLNNPTIVAYTKNEEVPTLSQTVAAHSKVRFLVSKDKTNYQAYKDNEWITIDRDNIIEQGMTKTELESIPQEVWAEWFENEAHKHNFNILIGMYSENPNKPLIRSITVNYAENEAPITIDAHIEPDTIHNEFATLKAHVKDYEGDKISFKVFIKRAGSGEFIQVSPLEGWYNRATSEEEITQAFNYPYFNPGENEIKLVVKDERGAESEWLGKIILSNTDPIISLTYDDFSMTATIGDDEDDSVAYKLSINNELIFDYTDFVPTKAHVRHVFDTKKLKFGEENTVTLEVKDTHGGYAKQEFKVIGSYRGLMFKNEDNKYFINDKGIILMDLLFDETLIGGQTSKTKKVTLENRHEFPISNVKVITQKPIKTKNENGEEVIEIIDGDDFAEGATLELSETEMPFNPKNIIKILETMPVQGTKDFYVRIKTNRDAHQGGYFYIKSTASPIIK